MSATPAQTSTSSTAPAPQGTSGAVRSTHATEVSMLERALGELAARATEWARLPVAEKAQLARACLARVVAEAPAWVKTGSAVKGLDPERDVEEWMHGPWQTARNLRLLAESLEAIARTGKPPLGRRTRKRADGRLEVDVFPSNLLDQVAFTGFTGKVILQAGIDEAEARRRQASFYARKDPTGAVALVLGAGNVSSIPPMDTFTKMFIEGMVCIIKMNPVNEWAGPHLERALAPLIDRGYLRIAYGGGDVGKFLCEHPVVADVHMTGSDAVHDLIVWGPPAEQARRKAANDPVLKKPMSSELGNVSPVVVTPWAYSDAELWFLAENVSTMVANNASFNCVAGKMLVLSAGWTQKDRFLELLGRALSAWPARKAYYPGAKDRWERLTRGRALRTFGQAGPGELPWGLIADVDPARADDPLFRIEPFCSLISATALPEADPVDFLAAATRFCNDRLWGTLTATIVLHPAAEKDGRIGDALDRAISELRYGTVSINHYAAVGYGMVTTPWGGHPSATLADVQSGIGWVHNTYMLEGIDKVVVRGPFIVRPRPTWFAGFGKGAELGKKLVAMEQDPSPLRLPSMIWTAIRG
jgi:acyl-CoA reductase-like NAD-dependent aldehyde dehydrogenase